MPSASSLNIQMMLRNNYAWQTMPKKNNKKKQIPRKPKKQWNNHETVEVKLMLQRDASVNMESSSLFSLSWMQSSVSGRKPPVKLSWHHQPERRSEEDERRRWSVYSSATFLKQNVYSTLKSSRAWRRLILAGQHWSDAKSLSAGGCVLYLHLWVMSGRRTFPWCKKKGRW